MNHLFTTWVEYAGLQVGEIYSLLEVLALTLTSVSGQELSPVPSLQSLGHVMQRGFLRSSSASLKPPWIHGLPWPKDNAEHLLLLPPSWSFLQDALPSHFIFKIVYAANSDFSSRALPQIWVHYSQVSLLNTVVDKRFLSGYSITTIITMFYKPWSTVDTQHLRWSSSRTSQRWCKWKAWWSEYFQAPSVRLGNTSLGLWVSPKETGKQD